VKGLSDTVIEGPSEGPTVALVYFSSQEKEEGRANATFCDCTETKKLCFIFSNSTEENSNPELSFKLNNKQRRRKNLSNVFPLN